MSAFSTPIQSEELDVQYLDGRNWRLKAEFDFASETLERIICVPAGFETDFASIPRVLWNILPPTGTYGKGSVLHDYLYRNGEISCSRWEADRVLLEAMSAMGASFLTMCVIYCGVRLGGGSSFHARGVAA